MTKLKIGILILILPVAANAGFFFTANDAMITHCIHTPISGKEALKSRLESAYGVKCTANEDQEGTVIVTCKANLTNMTFAAKTEAKCNSLRKSVKSMTGL